MHLTQNINAEVYRAQYNDPPRRHYARYGGGDGRHGRRT